MDLLNLVTEINRYCNEKGIKTIETTVSELTSLMIIESTKENGGGIIENR